MIGSSLIVPRQSLRPEVRLVYEWTGPDGANPPPQRRLRLARPLPPPLAGNGAPRFGGGPRFGLSGRPAPGRMAGLDFSAQMLRLFADIARVAEDFAHVDPQRLLVTMTSARRPKPHGLQAKVTPLRFREGKLLEQRRGRTYQVQRYRVAEVELLYLVTFCMPRFLNQPFDQKLTTVFHELWHIAPEFNGDLRRHRGRCCLHTSSKKRYDARMRELAEDYLKRTADQEALAFLREGHEQLHARHGHVRGVAVPMPKLVPVD